MGAGELLQRDGSTRGVLPPPERRQQIADLLLLHDQDVLEHPGPPGPRVAGPIHSMLICPASGEKVADAVCIQTLGTPFADLGA